MSYKKLLVLDDDDAVAKTIAFVAEGLGFSVRVHSDPIPFFEDVDVWEPSHIALDLVMPAMDGVEVIRNLARLKCPSAIIITSGMGTKVLESAHLSAVERGLFVKGVLPKPFDNRILKGLLTDSSLGKGDAAGLYVRQSRLDIVERTIRYGIGQHQFKLYYQPKIDFATGLAVGFEGLMRWEHPDFGTIFPDAFIGIAERTGQIDEMTRCIVEDGLRWIGDFDESVTLALNISASSLKDEGLVDDLNNACKSLSVNPNRVILELTETSTMMDPVESLALLTRLRLKGFRLSIDDFGTGYSSMVQLARLPFSELKVDKSFIVAMEHSEEARKIVASTVGLGHSLGLTTVAEGVESQAIHEQLRDLGCHLGQGYFYAKPMNEKQAATWLMDWNKS
jgi:EAL domain-containing protein (putative c-di-GMP-specific phosphodiesterase class I)/ActR/RegA family two-component response regulator